MPGRGLAKLLQLELCREGALGVCVSLSGTLLGSGGDRLPGEAGVPGARTHLEYMPLTDPELRQCGPGDLVLALPLGWDKSVCPEAPRAGTLIR